MIITPFTELGSTHAGFTRSVQYDYYRSSGFLTSIYKRIPLLTFVPFYLGKKKKSKIFFPTYIPLGYVKVQYSCLNPCWVLGPLSNNGYHSKPVTSLSYNFFFRQGQGC